jgi:hypothetical protein
MLVWPLTGIAVMLQEKRSDSPVHTLMIELLSNKADSWLDGVSLDFKKPDYVSGN